MQYTCARVRARARMISLALVISALPCSLPTAEGAALPAHFEQWDHPAEKRLLHFPVIPEERAAPWEKVKDMSSSKTLGVTAALRGQGLSGESLLSSLLFEMVSIKC